MKLYELLNVMNECQYADVFYKTDDGSVCDVVKNCKVSEISDEISDKAFNAEVFSLQVSRYNTFDVEIEKVVEPKKYSVHFEVSQWNINLEYDDEMVFEDGEDDDDIKEAIEEAYNEWLDNLKYDIDMYAEKEYELIED